MKRLTIEEKAEAYDLALERAKEKYAMFEGMKQGDVLEDVFPELREESEDEVVIAALKSGINGLLKEEYHLKGIGGISFDRINTWLENKGQTFTKKDVDDAWLKGMCDAKHELGKQGKQNLIMAKSPQLGEQKPADFHEGDWVVSPNGVYWHIDKIENNRYEVTSNTGESSNWPLDTNIYHKFTIQDAKKGDILACDKCILIFDQLSEFKNEQVLMDICHCTSKGFYWQDTKDRDLWVSDGFKPATKDQCNTLFTKMHEAGYEWDAEKKELKEIENEIEIPFGAKDSELQEATYFIPQGFHAEVDDDKVVIKKGEKSTAWSEEDDDNMMMIEDRLRDYLDYIREDSTLKKHIKNSLKEEVSEYIDWLKSIKQRIIE